MTSAATGVFSGDTVFPDDPRYPTLVRGFNLRWVGEPKYIALCGDTSQVVRAVQRALDEGLRITFRGGGHCYENFVCDNPGGVIIDLSPMCDVYLDAQNGWYCVEGGATLWNVYTRLEREHGVTIPGGSCYSVGAGGHVTAGGYGLLSRLYGLTVDYLHAVELVYVDASGKAESIQVSRDSPGAGERALLWAHQGGGGGNFGIVTRFWFKDPPPAPEYAELSTVAWNWSELNEDKFTKLVLGYGKWLAHNSEVGGPESGLFTLLHLNQNAGTSPQIVLTRQCVGAATGRADEFLATIADGLPPITAPARASGHPHAVASSTSAEALPWLLVSQTLNGSGPNRRGKYKSAYMIEEFPESQVTAMWEALSPGTLPQSQSLLQIDSYGGKVNAVAPDETAVAQRSSTMKLQFQTYWNDAAHDDENLAWIRAFYTSMYGSAGPRPNGTVDGCYVGYPDVDLPDWQWLYYKDNYSSLQQVKAQWDPGNVFNHSQSIELPG
jgi:FAD/FMN-containing dehydrogenase